MTACVCDADYFQLQFAICYNTQLQRVLSQCCNKPRVCTDIEIVICGAILSHAHTHLCSHIF